jgi:predicted ester cyclase
VYRTTFPDVRITIEDQVAEGDKVVTRWTGRGIHQGDLMGIAPTGTRATVTGITIDHISGGKVAETWANFDVMGMIQQLGVIPSPEQAQA